MAAIYRFKKLKKDQKGAMRPNVKIENSVFNRRFFAPRFADAACRVSHHEHFFHNAGFIADRHAFNVFVSTACR